MSSDDTTFLSAYLDGELDADQQQQVDSALASSPDLAEQLRALAVVRDMVAGLHREGGGDVAPLVLSRIRLQNRERSRSVVSRFGRHLHRAQQARAVAAILTIAAGIGLVVTVFIPRPSHEHGLAAGARAALDSRIVESTTGTSAGAGTDRSPIIALQPADPSPDASRSRLVALNAASAAIEPGAAAGAGSVRPANDDLEQSRKMLDSPRRRRFFLSKTGDDGKTQQAVASVVERTTRLGFFKITVSQGIVIDPRHPEEATVFALLVEPNDLDRLRDQLKVALPDLIEEDTADPAVVTQLADIGQVQSLMPAPLGDVSISREDLALRIRTGRAPESTEQPGAARPTAEQFRSAPLPTSVRAGSPTEPEHGPELAADDAARVRETTTTGRTTTATSASGAQVAISQPGSASRAAPALSRSDQALLVFVWICKPRHS